MSAPQATGLPFTPVTREEAQRAIRGGGGRWAELIDTFIESGADAGKVTLNPSEDVNVALRGLRHARESAAVDIAVRRSKDGSIYLLREKDEPDAA